MQVVGTVWHGDGGGTKERRSTQSTAEHTADGERASQSDPAKTSSQAPHMVRTVTEVRRISEDSSTQLLNLTDFRFAILKFTLSSCGHYSSLL